jgi:hypothetical protein
MSSLRDADGDRAGNLETVVVGSERARKPGLHMFGSRPGGHKDTPSTEVMADHLDNRRGDSSGETSDFTSEGAK